VGNHESAMDSEYLRANSGVRKQRCENRSSDAVASVVFGANKNKGSMAFGVPTNSLNCHAEIFLQRKGIGHHDGSVVHLEDRQKGSNTNEHCDCR